jgi:hypothetical protein
MLCQNFQSVTFPYRTTSELSPTLFPGITYHPEIPAPYAERLNRFDGIFFDPNHNGRIVLPVWMDQIYWPGWSRMTFVFDADTGEFVERGPEMGNYYLKDIFQGAAGELYANHTTAVVYPLDAQYQYLEDEVFYPSHFGAILFDCFLVDRQRDRMVMQSNLEVYEMGVYVFSTGALIRRIRLPERTVSIAHAEGTRVYLLLNNRQLVSLDYETEQFFGATKLPQITNVSTARITYDKRYRRVLVCEQTPDNPDGTSTVRIRGYRYRPVGVHVCQPIPLKRPRVERDTPVLHKLIGDLGEGIGGLITSAATDTNAQVLRQDVALDGDGEGVTDVRGLAEGGETVTVSAEVECQL